MPTPRSRAAEVFGARVRQARLALGVSQEQIAHRADIDVTNYGRIERGEANAELNTIVRLATALDTDPAELLAGLYGERMLPARERAFSMATFLASKAEKR